MPTYLAILRGINVSGKKKIKMEDLRILLSGLSFQNVRTYIQSGNVLFDAKKTAAAKLAEKIKQAIFTEYGFDVPVLVKERAAIEAVANNNPFLKSQKTEDIKLLHVTFLAENPSTEQIAGIEAAKYLPDEFIMDGKAIYLYCPNGYGRTKLTNTFFERKLKMKATTRNWKTTTKLLEMLTE